MGFRAGIEVAGSMLVGWYPQQCRLCAPRVFPEAAFGDRPDVTRMMLMDRVDPPSPMGSMDRIGR